MPWETCRGFRLCIKNIAKRFFGRRLWLKNLVSLSAVQAQKTEAKNAVDNFLTFHIFFVLT